MAVLLVRWHQENGFAHCMDVFEFVAAAGNVGHEVILVISGEALQYLSVDYVDDVSGKSTRKIFSSLPLYDVENIYLSESVLDTPQWIKVGVPEDLKFDYEVKF